MHPAEPTEPIFYAEGIRKAFKDRRVLTSASLELYRGRVTALMGRSGTGKSTFLRICAGMMPSDDGTIRFTATDGAQPSYPMFAQHGLYVLAADGTGAPGLTLRDHFAQIQSRYGAYDTEPLVHAFGLSDVMDKRLRALSGGERKLANIAIAVARNPTILLADEPFRDLAPLMIEAAGRALAAVAQNGAAVLITGHDAHAIFEYAHDIAWLVSGRIHRLGTPKEAKHHARFATDYLASHRPDNYFDDEN